MIINSLLEVINTLIGYLISAVALLWGNHPFPTDFVEAFSFIRGLNDFLPVTEALLAVSFMVAYFGMVWGLKWIVKVIDWLPIT
jgi:hypothetical protein